MKPRTQKIDGDKVHFDERCIREKNGNDEDDSNTFNNSKLATREKCGQIRVRCRLSYARRELYFAVFENIRIARAFIIFVSGREFRNSTLLSEYFFFILRSLLDDVRG